MGSNGDAGVRGRLIARFGAGVGPWLDGLPGVVGGLAKRWQLTVGPPIQRGSMSAVFRCRLADGQAAVLKVSPDRARLATEARALDGWRTESTPAVLGFDERLGALLLEAIEPGTPLVESAAYPALRSIAELLDALHHGGVADSSYPTVVQRVAYLFDASMKLYERRRDLTQRVPLRLYERGRHLASRLAADPSPGVLLHGDLTPSNLLDGGPVRGLVAIDPAPCVGDPAFDAVDLMLWRADDLATIEQRIEGLAIATELNADRIHDWCACFAAMSALELASQPGALPARVDALLRLA